MLRSTMNVTRLGSVFRLRIRSQPVRPRPGHATRSVAASWSVGAAVERLLEQRPDGRPFGRDGSQWHADVAREPSLGTRRARRRRGPFRGTWRSGRARGAEAVAASRSTRQDRPVAVAFARLVRELSGSERARRPRRRARARGRRCRRRRAGVPPRPRRPSAGPSLQPESPRSSAAPDPRSRSSGRRTRISSSASAPGSKGRISAQGSKTRVSTTDVALSGVTATVRTRPSETRVTSWIRVHRALRRDAEPREEPELSGIAGVLDRGNRGNVDLPVHQHPVQLGRNADYFFHLVLEPVEDRAPC